MAPHRDSYAELRDRLRWQVAVVLGVLIVVLMVALGLLNTRLGLPDTARLAWIVLGVSASSLALLWVLPRRTGGMVFFVVIAALLVLVPLYGLQHGRVMQHWSYVFPPVAVFLLRPLPSLWAMLAYGVMACAVLARQVALIEVVRFGAGYGLLVCFMFTYALLQQRAAAMLRYHSDHDALSNCFNRRTFNEALERLQSRDRGAARCAVILLDIDHFKSINDRHGHLVGARVITEVAALLGRGLDAGTPLYRYGGEEFAVLLRDAGEAEALALAERLRAAVAATPMQGLHATLSAGVAAWRAGDGTLEDALARADRALYAAKAAGRNRVFADAASQRAATPG